ncbi:MAG: ABC transporter substrate-binding protein [Deltaproteobacteria bacterium]|nr:ABC transporter substrate-binding protein [Deltaproteobacteria bacterium]
MNRGFRLVSLFFFLLAIFLYPVSAPAQETRKLRAAYTSISGNMTPLWAAREGGYLKKYGLDVDIISMPSGNEGMNALIAGEVEFLAIAGSTTATAAVGGAEVIALATTIERLVTSLIVGPAIQKPEDLKGKSVGISRFGTSIDTAARMAIQHYGLEPIKDVAITQIGAMSSILTALRANRIQAAILSYPSITQARREGFRELLDIASLGMPYASTGISVRKAFVQQRRDVATNYVKAVVEAIARLKKDKPFALEVMSKYLRTKDRDVLEETYGVSVVRYLKRVPLPTPEAFRSVLEELAQTNPKAKGQDLRKFYDDSIVLELERSGFINSLYP